MSRIKRLVFWVGGTLLPPLAEMLLLACGSGTRPTGDLREALYRLEQAAARGGLGAADLCHAVSMASSGAPTPAEIEAAVLNNLTLQDGMAALISDLAPGHILGLVSDYPNRWLEPSLRLAGIDRHFADPLCLTMESHAPNTRPSQLLHELKTSGFLIPGSTLWIDRHPHRTEIALRLGLDAALMADTPRLQRDLRLWGIVV